jgi:hypothetical protein
MTEPTTDPLEPPAPEAVPGRPPARGRRGDLEDRVRKLEAAVGELKESAVTEEVVTDRVLARLQAMATAPRPLAGPSGVLYDETGPVAGSPAADAPPPPKGAVLQPPRPPEDPARRSWFLAQLWAEFRLLARMYFDPRYRVSRTAQLVVPVVLGLFALNYFAFSVWFSVAVISPVAERVVCVLLGVFLYKVLVRELTRYRGVLDYWAKYPPRP